MRTRSKKIFLVMSIVVPFLLYCFYYYGMMIKNAPYKFSEFQSIHFEYGYGDTLNNIYDSKTGEYQFVNRRDSLVKVNLKLSKDDSKCLLAALSNDNMFWRTTAQRLLVEKGDKSVLPELYKLVQNKKLAVDIVKQCIIWKVTVWVAK